MLSHALMRGQSVAADLDTAAARSRTNSIGLSKARDERVRVRCKSRPYWDQKDHAIPPHGEGSGAGLGSLVSEEAASAFSGFRKFKPTGRLRHIVDSIVVGDVQLGCSSLHLPDGRVRLTLRFQTPKFTANEGGLQVLGAGTQHLQSAVPKSRFGFAVVFKPGGAYPFLGVPLNLLTNQSNVIEDVWPKDGERYRDRLLEARTIAEQLSGLAAMLDARFPQMGAQQLAWQRIAKGAAGLLRRDRTTQPHIRAVADWAGMSPRQLRRIFESIFGLGPKEFARVMRFQRALHLAARQEIQDYAAVAIACGFSDQAHMIREFQVMAGVSPAQFLRVNHIARPTVAFDDLRLGGVPLLGGIISSPGHRDCVY